MRPISLRTSASVLSVITCGIVIGQGSGVDQEVALARATSTVCLGDKYHTPYEDRERDACESIENEIFVPISHRGTVLPTCNRIITSAKLQILSARPSSLAVATSRLEPHFG